MKPSSVLQDDIRKGIVVIESTEILGTDDKTYDI